MAYKKYKKQKISQNTKAIITIVTLGVAITGIEGMEYLKDKQMIEYQLSENEKSNVKSLGEIQEETLRNNAISYNATDFLNEIATLDYEDEMKFKSSLEGQYIEMTGTVMSVKTDNLLYEDHFTLGNISPDSLVAHYGLINCDVEDSEQKEKLKELESGDMITIIGKFYSEYPFINIGDCDIVDIEKGDGEYSIDLSGIYN